MKRASIIGGLVLWLLLAVAGPASAATLTGTAGCTLEVESVNADGTALDEAFVQGTIIEGSQSDPFDIAWDGRVDFRFQTGETVFQNNEWAIYAMGVPIPILRGSDDNPTDLDEIGNVVIADSVPDGTPRIVGLVNVTGWLEGNEGAARCDGDGWVRIVGDPVGTIPWLAMLALLLLGLVFLIATPYTADWEEGELTPWQGGPRPEGT